MDQIAVGVLTSAVVGILSWAGGKVLVLAGFGIKKAGTTLAGAQPYQAVPGGVPVAQPTGNVINPAHVLAQVGLLQFIVNVVAYAIGVLVSAAGNGTNLQQLQAIDEILILIVGTLTAIVFFFFVGLRLDRAIRWRHLTYVALGTAVATVIVNFVVARAFGEQLLSSAAAIVIALMGASIQSFVSMGIGGGLAALVAPKRAPVPAMVSQPYMPAPGGPYPYGYGAPPSTPMYPGYPPQVGAPPSTPMYPGYPPAPPGAPVYPGYGAPPSTPMYPPYGQPPAAPPGSPMYPPSGQQYPPQGQYYPTQPGAQAPGTYQPGWGAPPPANPGAAQAPANPATNPALQQPPQEQEQGHQETK